MLKWPDTRLECAREGTIQDHEIKGILAELEDSLEGGATEQRFTEAGLDCYK